MISPFREGSIFSNLAYAKFRENKTLAKNSEFKVSRSTDSRIRNGALQEADCIKLKQQHNYDVNKVDKRVDFKATNMNNHHQKLDQFYLNALVNVPVG